MLITEVTPVRSFHVTDLSRRSLHIQVAGIVRPAGTPGPVPEAADQDEASTRADSARASLFGQAQTAIIAAEDRGYRHWRHPEINVTGELHFDQERDLDTMIAECTLRMWLWCR
jgi:hypothetical protein